MEEAPAIKTRGTRPFEAMVPCKPWTSQFLSVDDITAPQSRRGPHQQRYRDGTFRPDRPLPPGMVRGQPEPRLTLSPRALNRPDPTWFWESVHVPAEPTTRMAFKFAHDSPREVPPKRHTLSQQYQASQVGDIVFNDPAMMSMSERAGRPPPGILDMEEVDSAESSARYVSGEAELKKLTEAQRVKHAAVAVRHERRKVEHARAALMSSLRRDIDAATLPVGYHEPLGMPTRGRW